LKLRNPSRETGLVNQPKGWLARGWLATDQLTCRAGWLQINSPEGLVGYRSAHLNCWMAKDQLT